MDSLRDLREGERYGTVGRWNPTLGKMVWEENKACILLKEEEQTSYTLTNTKKPLIIPPDIEVKKETPKACHARKYQITVFDKNKTGIYSQVIAYLQGRKQLTYIITCWEMCPDTKNEHWHIFCAFNNSVQINAKKICYSHVEVCRGSVQENIDYIKKCGKYADEWNSSSDHHKDLLEWGTPPREANGKLSGAMLMEMSYKEIATEEPIYHRVYFAAKQYLEASIDIDDWAKKVTVYYIQGPSGAGKTERAKQIVRDTYPIGQRQTDRVKFQGEFWRGINDAKVCIYDEWRSSQMKPSEFISFIDYNRQSMNIKGGDKINNYELIIITSVEPLHTIYGNVTGEPREQWERRITLINMETSPPPAQEQ